MLIRRLNVVLYRDDGLGILRNLSGPEIERKRKEIIEIFKICRLNITVKVNLEGVGFLAERSHLINNTRQPYRKPNSETVYINKHSNHLLNILRNYPKQLINK